MPKKAFITGITGFAGSFLAEHLVNNKDYSVSGTYLKDESLINVSPVKDHLDLFKVDLINEESVYAILEKIKPDLIFHLAAISSPANSFKNPTFTINNNISAEINILEAVQRLGFKNTRVLIVSSADVYGTVSEDNLPIDEETPFMPNNTYAVSKIAQDFLGLQYFLSYGISVVRVRPFNHIGPRQVPLFVVPSFAKRIAEIEKGLTKPTLKVGNLDTYRDFTDVRDMVIAYELILEKGTLGDVYNIGFGKDYKISDILEKLISFSSKKISVEVDKSLLRPSDTQKLVCDNSKLKTVINWEPKIEIEKTLQNTLDYWRHIV